MPDLLKENEELKKKVDDMEKTANMKRRKTDNPWYAWAPKIVEIVAVVLLMWGGMRVTINTLCIDVDKLKTTVGTSSQNKGNICERTNTLETKFDFIEKALIRIEGKIDGKGK